ncbi:MAG: putative toxin-antitoxin system toxin component, PIN family [candidate division KSB1 bacterium]
MRAVIDTNVFLSALINRSGAPSKLRRRWLDGQFVLVTSEPVEFEYADVLLHSPVVPASDVFDLLDEINCLSLVVSVAGTLAVCKDTDDDIFLETAIAGSADFLVTKNLKHFPRKAYQNVRIVTVATFLTELEKVYP